MTGRSSRKIYGKHPFLMFFGRGDTDGSAAGDPGSSQAIMIIQKSSFLVRPGDEGDIDINF